MSETEKFWSLSPENGKLSIQILDLYKGFLHDRGFRKKKIEEVNEIYKLNGHIVEETFKSDQINEISRFFLEELKVGESIRVEYARKDPATFNYAPREILEHIIKFGWNRIFSDHNLNHLNELTVPIRRHSRTSAFFYFKNGFVEVSRDGAKLRPYSEIEGQYVFKDSVINREIALLEVNDPVTQEFCPGGYNFFDFLHRISGVPEEDEAAGLDKVCYLMECLGFLLHDYKQKGLTDFAVIFCDDNMGGSGKGILIQALSQMTKVTEIDMKKEDKFDPVGLTSRTRVKVYGDIEPSFSMRRIYNEITEPAQIRPMWKSPYYVPYLESWKMAITANHIIRGITDADLRRQRVFSLHSFFSKKYSPINHYEQSFFSEDWKDQDWNYFYSLMFECARFWLLTDYKLAFTDVEYEERKLEEEYPMELREYVEELLAEVKTNGTQTVKFADFYYKFKENDRYRLNPFVRKLTPSFFSRILRKYLDQSLEYSYSRSVNRTELTVFLKRAK